MSVHYHRDEGLGGDGFEEEDAVERELSERERGLNRCVYSPGGWEREFPAGGRLYTLKIALLSGRGWDYPLRGEGSVSRTIEMVGEQTLRDLHWAIFWAFDRIETHLYEFQFGRRPRERGAPRYVTPGCEQSLLEGLFGRKSTIRGRVDRTTLGDLGLAPRVKFFYRFDFGDDWWHRITVAKIADDAPAGTYPRLVKSVGGSPPQYEYDEEG